MSYRHFSALLIGLILIVSSFSCKKDNATTLSSFYGNWKTSYGDTVTFAKQNGQNVVFDFPDYSPGPSSPGPVRGFGYMGGKLLLKYDAALTSPYFTVESFQWVQPGKVFTLRNTEWFPFMSSISTFTFTKIQ